MFACDLPLFLRATSGYNKDAGHCGFFLFSLHLMILEKKRLRSRLLQKREAFLKSHETSVLTPGLNSHLLSFVELYTPHPCLLYGFWPLPTEPDIRPALQSLYHRSYSIGLPKILSFQSPLSFGSWTPPTSLAPNPHLTSIDLLEPKSPDLELGRPLVVFVPCLGYDHQGHRLGYGKGLYDRTLYQIRSLTPQCMIVGVSFSCGLMADLPHGPHDHPLNAVITEEKFHLFSYPSQDR